MQTHKRVNLAAELLKLVLIAVLESACFYLDIQTPYLRFFYRLMWAFLCCGGYWLWMVYIRTYILAYMYPYIQTRMHTCIQRDIRTHVCMDIHAYIHTYIHTYVFTYMRTHIHTHIHTHMRTYAHIYTHPSIHPSIHTSIHPYIHTSIHTYIHTYIHTCIHTHTYLGGSCQYLGTRPDVFPGGLAGMGSVGGRCWSMDPRLVASELSRVGPSVGADGSFTAVIHFVGE